MNFERWFWLDVVGRNNKLWLRFFVSRLDREIRERVNIEMEKKKGEVEREAKR